MSIPLSEDTIEQLAQLVHEDSRSRELNRGRPADVPWHDLEPHFRGQNRHQVRHTLHQLERHGFAVVPEKDAGDAPRVNEFPAAILEQLAIEEHHRWVDTKRRSGFVYGPDARSPEGDRPGTHPNLVDWDELDEENRDRNRDPISSFPEVCRSADLAVVDRR